MKYKASFDKLAKGITIGTTLFFIALIYMNFLVINEVNIFIILSAVIPIVLIYVLTYGYSPSGYEVSNESLLIHRPFKNVKINRNEIVSIQRMDKKLLRKSIRTFGVGGLFGYYGKFSHLKVGNMIWYATQRDNFILLKTVNRKSIVLTPDEPDKFLENFM